MTAENTEDLIALTYAGAYLREIGKRSAAQVNTTLRDLSGQRSLIAQLVSSARWRNEWAPFLRSAYTVFAALDHKHRARTLLRVLPGVRPNRELDLQGQFFLLVQAMIRRVAEKRDVMSVIQAMGN